MPAGMVYQLPLFKYSNILNVVIVYYGDIYVMQVCNAHFWTDKSKSEHFSQVSYGQKGF